MGYRRLDILVYVVDRGVVKSKFSSSLEGNGDTEPLRIFSLFLRGLDCSDLASFAEAVGNTVLTVVFELLSASEGRT